MLVSEKHKALLLATRYPGKVTSVIPKAKVLREQPGKTILAVRHTLESYKVLRNIGFNAPHPIKHYYSWPCAYPAPMAHQVETAAFLSTHTRAYCLSGLGSAKTLSSLWAFDYLRSIGVVRRLLVVAPLSTLERTWVDEVFRHFPHLEPMVVYGTRKQRERQLKAPADVYIINHDGIKVMLPELTKFGFDVVIFDELTQVARNPRSQRWKAANEIVKTCLYAWGLTGTPIPNDPTDAYGQIKLLTPTRAPRSFTLFQDMVTRLVGPFKRVPKYDAEKTILDMMQPAIRFATRDCVDLPETIYLTRHVPLEPDLERMYKQMLRQKVMSVDDRQIVGVNEAVVHLKCVQIATGAVLDPKGEVIRVESKGRLQEVKDHIEQAEGRVIVFAPFLGAVDYLTDELRQEYGEYAVGRVDGRVKKSERDDVFASFQNKGPVKVIVAQPSAMSHGITLTAGSMIIWFAPPYSNETYEQANARIVRPGQKRTTIIVNIEGTDLERKTYERLAKRQAMQGSLLTMVENLTN